jgi:hypothetical protein
MIEVMCHLHLKEYLTLQLIYLIAPETPYTLSPRHLPTQDMYMACTDDDHTHKGLHSVLNKNRTPHHLEIVDGGAVSSDNQPRVLLADLHSLGQRRTERCPTHQVVVIVSGMPAHSCVMNIQSPLDHSVLTCKPYQCTNCTAMLFKAEHLLQSL